MALIVSFENISNLADVSDYKVDVWVNNQKIAGPFPLKGHKRSEGWAALVRKFAVRFDENSSVACVNCKMVFPVEQMAGNVFNNLACKSCREIAIPYVSKGLKNL